MEQQDKIKAYLRGDLSHAEAEAFRREMGADPALADWVRTTKQLMLLEEMEAREKIRGYLKGGVPPQVSPPHIHYIKKTLRIAAGMALLMAVIWLLYPLRRQENRMANEKEKQNMEKDTIEWPEPTREEPYPKHLNPKNRHPDKHAVESKQRYIAYALQKGNQWSARMQIKSFRGRSPQEPDKVLAFKSKLDSLKLKDKNKKHIFLDSTALGVGNYLFLSGLQYFKDKEFDKAEVQFGRIIVEERSSLVSNDWQYAAYYRALCLLVLERMDNFKHMQEFLCSDTTQTLFCKEIDSLYMRKFSIKYKKNNDD